jgi:hypothetical protein
MSHHFDSPDLQVITIEISSGVDLQQVQIPYHLIKHCMLFHDMISVFGSHVVIPFPTEYNHVANIYIKFISDSYINDNDGSEDIFDQLKDINILVELLKLSHYIGDDKFLSFIIAYMHGHMHQEININGLYILT